MLSLPENNFYSNLLLFLILMFPLSGPSFFVWLCEEIHKNQGEDNMNRIIAF